jgi:hypothetical protein
MALSKKPARSADTGNLYKDWYEYNYHNSSEGLTQIEREELKDYLVAKQAKKLARFQAIAGVYQTADSVLTKASITVTAGDFSNLESMGEAPAFNDGKTIYLNTNVLAEIDDNSLISLNGINYHEVAHILWSPRGNSEFGRKVTKGGYQNSFNILEDLRIETLMTARFPSTTLSLTQSVLTYIMDTPDPSDSFPLIRGRRYLPIEVRQLSADLYVGKHGSVHTASVARIVDEYRLLTYPSDYERGYDLIVEFHNLLKLGSPDNKTEGQCGSRPMLKSGRPENGEKQSNIANRAKGMDKKAEDIKLDDKSGAGAGAGVEGESQDYNPLMERTEMDNEFANVVREAIKSVMKSKQAKIEARQLRSAIREIDRAGRTDLKATSELLPVDNVYRVASKAFGQELSKLRIDSDPHWDIEKPVGRLNINRVMNMDINDINTVFDEWNEGRDDFNIEAVIMCDTSGSMSTAIKEVSQSMWAIKRALEEIDGKVTVIGFSDKTKLIYGSNELATSQYRFWYDGGGTDPIDGLLEAEAILESSRRKTKLLFVITDGEWSRSDDCDSTIKRINNIDGTISQIVFISTNDWIKEQSVTDREATMARYRHQAHSIELVSKPNELVSVARNILRSL